MRDDRKLESVFECRYMWFHRRVPCSTDLRRSACGLKQAVVLFGLSVFLHCVLEVYGLSVGVVRWVWSDKVTRVIFSGGGAGVRLPFFNNFRQIFFFFFGW